MTQLKHVQQKLQDSKIAVSSFRPEIEGYICRMYIYNI